MKTPKPTLALAILIGACTSQVSPDTEIGQTSESSLEDASKSETSAPARIVEYEMFNSAFVQPRNLSIWLPDGYGTNPDARYKVIYAHDGQNLFEPGYSYGGVEWGLDETAETLMADGKVPQAIIVGIWNTDARWQEYAPQKVIENLTGDTSSEWLGPELPDLKGDAYLRFIVEELKPFVDETYQTLPDQDHTYIMGSSMGGLISLYAMAEYPDTFRRAASVSIHWPLTEPEGAMAQQADAAMQAYLATSGIDAGKHTIWFDHGTETLDAAYPPHAEAMEAWFRAQGWDEEQAIFKSYPGTDHSEGAWAARADQILTFLLTD